MYATDNFSEETRRKRQDRFGEFFNATIGLEYMLNLSTGKRTFFLMIGGVTIELSEPEFYQLKYRYKVFYECPFSYKQLFDSQMESVVYRTRENAATHHKNQYASGEFASGLIKNEEYLF